MSQNTSKNTLINVNIVSEKLLPTPADIQSRVPATVHAKANTTEYRTLIENILDRKDPRLFVVVGPCSIHDPKAAIEYAGRLRELANEIGDAIVPIMRVYFEKPRTSVGWKGFINDPYLDDSFHIEDGLVKARELLVQINEMGLPTGTEALDPITPQYLNDLVTWSAIGARTTESQTHREMASGLSTPVGFKNGTDGGIEVAINALKSVSQSHRFLGINLNGQCTVFHTRGNRYGHVVLRGGARPNYDSVSVALCEDALRQAKLPVNVVIDCSHGNSLKNHELQKLVMENCVNQIVEGNKSIVGTMIESHLFAGNQPLTGDPSKLRYGVSVTDACMDWPSTATMLKSAAERLRPVLRNRMS